MSGEAFPDRKRNARNRETLVYSPANDTEKLKGTFTSVGKLEANQISVEHDAYIVNVFQTPDGGYTVVLSNGDKLPLDRDDGLVVRNA